MKKNISLVKAYFTKHPFYYLLLLLVCITTNTKAQLDNEIGFSTGPIFVPHSTVYPGGYGASFAASDGFGFQLDYKLMNKSVGIQLSFTYAYNNYDSDYAYNVLNATSYTADNWYSIIGMVKFVARSKTLKDKLLFDFSLGMGGMQGNFSHQTFKYEDNTAPEFQVRNMYSPERVASGMVLGLGLRVSYLFADDLGVFLNYDYLYGAQNYSVVYQEINTQIDSITKVTRIKRNHSLLFIGVLIPI